MESFDQFLRRHPAPVPVIPKLGKLAADLFDWWRASERRPEFMLRELPIEFGAYSRNALGRALKQLGFTKKLRGNSKGVSGYWVYVPPAMLAAVPPLPPVEDAHVPPEFERVVEDLRHHMTAHRLRRSRRLFDSNGNEVFVRMICTRCGESKAFDEFGIRKVGGVLKSIPQCASCRGLPAKQTRPSAVLEVDWSDPEIDWSDPRTGLVR